MVLNHKPTGRTSSMQAGLAVGMAISLTITIVASSLLAKLIALEYMDEANIGYGVMATIFTASFLGAVSSVNRIKRRRFLVCVLSAGLYFGILLSITALFFGGQYEAVGVTAILIIGGSMLPLLIGNAQNRGGRRRKIRKTNC